MGHIEMGNAYVAALNAQQWDTVATFLTDDFMLSSTTLGSQGKQAYLADLKAWFAGAPDCHTTWEAQREEGDTVHGIVHVRGTQTNTLALSGLPPIPATGRRFEVTYPASVTWRANKIAAMSFGAQSTPTVLEQLGVQPPAS